MSKRQIHRFPADEWPRLVADRRRALAEPEHYVAAFPWPRGSLVVDVGCGPGFFTGPLLDALDGLDGHLISLDVEPRMLSRLGSRLGSDWPALPRAAANATAIPLRSGVADTVWCAFVLHEVPDLPQAARELARICAPNGRVIALEWEARPTDHGPPADERVAAAEVAEALAAAGLTVRGPTAVTDSQYALLGTPE